MHTIHQANMDGTNENILVDSNIRAVGMFRRKTIASSIDKQVLCELDLPLVYRRHSRGLDC